MEHKIFNKKHGFTQIENCILRSSVLSQSAKLVYADLVSYDFNSKGVFPGQDRMAWDLRMSLRTIIRAIKELESWGLITVERRGRNKPNFYIIEEVPQKLKDMFNFTQLEWKIQKDMSPEQRAERNKVVKKQWKEFGWI